MAGILSVSGAFATRLTRAAPVPVKLVRPTAPAPPPPPPPTAAGSKPRAQTPQRPAPIVQPAEVAQELMPPEPPPEPEGQGDGSDEGDEGDASDEGVEGGVGGGIAGGIAGGGAPGPPRPAGPVKFNASMAAPKVLFAPPLEYTQRALDREVEGTMLVECIVSVDGAVRHCRVLRSLPFMDRAVVENLERRRYEPATLGGKPLDVAYTFTIRLKLPE